MGELHLAKHQPDIARPLFERAVAILEPIVKATDVDLQRAKRYLAKPSLESPGMALHAR